MLTSLSNVKRHTENGVATDFAFDFKVDDPLALEVTSIDLDGAETLLTYLTDFTVTGLHNNAGGYITKTPATSGFGLVIRRVEDITQTTQLRGQTALDPVVLEDALDKLTKIDQQHAEQLSRTFSLSVDGVNMELPAPEPGYALGWNIDGDALVNVPNTGADQTAQLSDTDNPANGAGMIGFDPDLVYPVNSIGPYVRASHELIGDLQAASGASLVGFQQAGTGAVARTVQDKGLERKTPEDFGAVGDGVTDDTAEFLLASASAGLGEYKTLELCAGRTYLVKRSQVFRMVDGVSIVGNGATILVPADAAPQGDYTYGDGVIYVPINTSVKDISIDGVKFDIRRADIDAISVGVFGTAESATRSNVAVTNCYHTGGFNFLKARQITGLQASGNHVYLTGEGIAAQECSGVISGNVLRYVGVSADLSTWNNTQPIQVPASRGMVISGNTLEYTGGTAISTTSTVETYDVAIIGNVIRNAGLAGIGVGPKADGAISKNITVIGNVIRGFCCAPASNAHSGIGMVGVGVNSVSDGFVISENVIDFLGTYETYNTTTNDVVGSLNTLKGKNAVFGSTAALQANGASNGTVNSETGSTIIANNTIRHAPSNGLTATWLKDVTVSGNKLERCGYQRTVLDQPPSASVGINVTETGQTTITNNTVIEMAPGCAGGNSFGIRLVRPWKSYVAGNQLWNSVATWATNPLGLFGSAGGFSFYGLTGAKHEFHCEKNTATNYVNALAYTGSTGSFELTLAPGDRKLANAVVGTDSTSLAHTLGKIPKSITVVPRGNVVVWQSAVADATNVYLRAASATNVDVYLG